MVGPRRQVSHPALRLIKFFLKEPHLAVRPQGLDAFEFAVAHHAVEDGLQCRELVLLSDVLWQPSRLDVKPVINGQSLSRINFANEFQNKLHKHQDLGLGMAIAKGSTY